MISSDVTVGRLLGEHPSLIEVLASFHPHFAQLRDPRRRVMATRVTLAEAARIAGVPVDDLVAALRRAAGEAPHPSAEWRPPDPPAAGQRESASKPDVPASRQVHLDVREDIRGGREPFARIMAVVKGLAPGQALVLRAPFEPVPLYEALGQRGFTHWAERRAADDWSVWFHRRAEPAGAPSVVQTSPQAGGRALTIDVRGLEPPEPMVRILEAVERMRAGDAIEVLHERRPMFLYPQLDERGFPHETDESEPGLVRIVIRHGGAGA
jgi:uncharacterized protein (DUF2249 family)